MVVKFIKANIFHVNPVINFILFEFQTKIKLKYTMTLGKHRFVVLGAMHTEKKCFLIVLVTGLKAAVGHQFSPTVWYIQWRC